MLYQHLLVATIVGLWSFQVVAQQTKPAQRQDSVTVSAGISKEQLALEDQLKAIVSQGDQALKNGNTAEAIRQYEAALKLAQNQPLLAEQRNRVLLALLGNELVRHPWLREKMREALFFKMLRSWRRSSFSRFKCRISSSCGV